jgi:hypothetical protein
MTAYGAEQGIVLHAMSAMPQKAVIALYGEEVRNRPRLSENARIKRAFRIPFSSAGADGLRSLRQFLALFDLFCPKPPEGNSLGGQRSSTATKGEKDSIVFSSVHVFTQPRSQAEVRAISAEYRSYSKSRHEIARVGAAPDRPF